MAALPFASSTTRPPALSPCKQRMSSARPSLAFAVNRALSQARDRHLPQRLSHRHSFPWQGLRARPDRRASLDGRGNPARLAWMDRRDLPARRVPWEPRVRLVRKAIQGPKARRDQPVPRGQATRLPRMGCPALSALLALKVRPDRPAHRDLKDWPDTRVHRGLRANRDRGESPVRRAPSGGMDHRACRERLVLPGRSE